MTADASAPPIHTPHGGQIAGIRARRGVEPMAWGRAWRLSELMKGQIGVNGMDGQRGVIIMAVLSGVVSIASGQSNSGLPDIGLGWATVGDPGNPGYDGLVFDSGSGQFFTAPHQGRGTVGYTYQITRSEINTRDLFDFVSTVDRSNPAINTFLNVQFGALWLQNGFSGPYELNPFLPEASREQGRILVNGYQAMAYANWLHNGQPSDPQSLFNGAYNIGELGSDGSITLNALPQRQAGALFAVANLDEYMKAGYYDPNRFGDGEGGWWTYAHQSEQPPISGLPGLGGEIIFNPGNAELEFFGISGSNTIPLGQFPATVSAYGLIDVMGGSSEIVEEFVDRGDFSNIFWNPSQNFEGIDFWDHQAWSYFDTGLSANVGSFRIVSLVPSPGSSVAFGVVGLVTARRRRGA